MRSRPCGRAPRAPWALAHLARPASETLCVFGTGVQARIQVVYALRQLPAIKAIRYVTRHGAPDPIFESAFPARCHVAHADDPDAAVAGSDVIITATPGGGPLFDAEGGAARHAYQCRRHRYQRQAGAAGGAFCPASASSSTTGARPARSARHNGPPTPMHGTRRHHRGEGAVPSPDEDITVFDMTGIALQDLAVRPNAA